MNGIVTTLMCLLPRIPLCLSVTMSFTIHYLIESYCLHVVTGHGNLSSYNIKLTLNYKNKIKNIHVN